LNNKKSAPQAENPLVPHFSLQHPELTQYYPLVH